MVRTIFTLAVAVAACKGSDEAMTTVTGSATAKPVAAPPPPPPAIGDKTIRVDGVGPITAKTPATIEALTPLFPGVEVVVSKNRGDTAEINDTPRIEIGDQLFVPMVKDATTVTDIEVIGDGYATPGNVHVGSTVGDLAAANPKAACRMFAADNIGELTCFVVGAGSIVYSIEDGGYKGVAGNVVPADIARRTITQITWRAK